VRALAPALLDEPGVGPIVAAQLIVAWSHRGRLRSEACFARLAGVAPVPASSVWVPETRIWVVIRSRTAFGDSCQDSLEITVPAPAEKRIPRSVRYTRSCPRAGLHE
jgi:hypothetical protein